MSRKLTIAAVILAVGTIWAFNWRPTTAQEQSAQDVAAAVQATNESVEVLTRGPVHEAFAEPVNLQGFDPLMIQMAPPEPVEELPPQQKPEGDYVLWIPGYWAWDDDRNSFIWVSGVWRDVPPGQKWIPGYWSEGEGGWYWTAGFWVSEEAEELEYLPQPPETLEVGPQIDAPSEDHMWVPGTWRYQQTRYVWRPGYWTVVQPGWVWVPARYIWCPTGYVFVGGYWDYPLEERGVLFAPVYYHQPVYRYETYYYTPSVVISTDILTVHLFARPRYSHYYFGDYYAPRYREIGIEPWLMFPRVRGCYDPLYHYYGWHHRRYGRGDWHGTLNDRYQFFARYENYRPAHTYAALRRQRFDRIRTGNINIQNNIQDIVLQQNNLAVNINQYVKNVERNVRIDDNRGRRRGRLRFAKLDDSERRRMVAHARDIRGFQERRREVEREARVGDRGQLARGERQARRALQLADYGERRGDREARERGERRGGRSRDRDGVAADVPASLDRTRGRATGRPDGVGDAISGADRPARRGRSFDRSGRPETTPDQDATRDAIGRRGRTREQDAALGALGQRDRTQDEDRTRDAIARPGRGRDSRVGTGRTGRDGLQFPSTRTQQTDRDATTQSRTQDTGRNFRPTDRLDYGRQRRNEDLRRRQPTLREQLGLDDAQQGPQGVGRGLPRGSGDRDASALRNRPRPGRGDENRPQADPIRRERFDRDAVRPRPQFGQNDAPRSPQIQRQEALRQQTQQLRGGDQRSRSNNLQQLLDQQRREAGRQRESAADRQSRQPFGRGRGNERTAFGDRGQGDSDTRRRALGSFPGRQNEHQAPDVGRQGARSDDRQQRWGQLSRERGGQAPGGDARSRLERGGGRPASDLRSRARPDARSPLGDRGGRGGAGGRPDVSRQSNRGGRPDFAPQRRDQSPSREAMNRGRPSAGEDRRGRDGGGRRGGQRRDRDDDD